MIYIETGWFDEVFNINSKLLLPQKAILSKKDIIFKNNFFFSFDKKNDLLKTESDVILFLEKIIFNIFTAAKCKSGLNEDAEKQPQFIKKIIDNNFTDEISLDYLSRISNENKFKLLRKFSKQYKLTPHAYLINKRIEYAKELLLLGKTIAEVAVMAGFFDQSHFIKTFKNYVGMNPVEYK